MIFHKKEYHGSLRLTYRYARVHYEYVPLRVGYVLEYDRRRLLKESWRLLKVLLMFASRYKRLQEDYRKEILFMTSRAYWEGVYYNKSLDQNSQN